MTEPKPWLFRLDVNIWSNGLRLSQDQPTTNVTNVGNIWPIPDSKPSRKLEIRAKDVVIVFTRRGSVPL